MYTDFKNSKNSGGSRSKKRKTRHDESSFMNYEKMEQMVDLAKSNRIAQHSVLSNNNATTQQVVYSTLSDRQAIANAIIDSLIKGDKKKQTIKDLKQVYTDADLNENGEHDTIDDFYVIVFNKFKMVERFLKEKSLEPPREDIYFMVENLTKF